LSPPIYPPLAENKKLKGGGEKEILLAMAASPIGEAILMFFVLFACAVRNLSVNFLIAGEKQWEKKPPTYPKYLF